MTTAEALPAHYRWNSIAFLVEFACFGGVVLTLLDPTSVLPAFVRQLTDSEFMVGLISAIFNGGWLLPQLAVGRLINEEPRKKPYMLAGLSGRVFLWVIALALWARLDRNPTAMLVLSFICIGLFAVSDGVVVVAWLDIIARAIPWKQRGRLIGLAQFISGLIGVGAGALVSLILAVRSFSDGYALIFTLVGVALIPCTIAQVLVREPQPEEVEPHELVEGEGLQFVEDEGPEVTELEAEPVAAVSGDEIEVVEGDQGVESGESEEVEVVANDVGFWASFVEEG